MNSQDAKVLIIDNEAMIRRYMESCVVQANQFGILMASSLSEALQEIKQHRPLVILFDLMLNDIHPIDFIDQIRSLQTGYYPYLITTSIIKNDSLTRKAYEQGADYYLEKNFKCFELAGILENILRHHKNTKQIAESELRYRSLFQMVSDVMLLINCRNLTISDANLAAIQLLGIDVPNEQRLPLANITPEISMLKNLMSEKHQLIHGIRIQKTNGSAFMARINLVYFQVKGEEHAIMSINNISQSNDDEERDALSKYLLKNKPPFSHEMVAYLSGEENERRRISSEIHDHVGQIMVSAKLAAENTMFKYQNEALKTDLQNVSDHIIEAIWAIRSIAHNIGNDNPSNLGLKERLSMLVTKFSQNTGIPFNFQWEGDDMNSSSFIESNIYRICEESLNNIAKHAHSNAVSVFIQYLNSAFRMEINNKSIRQLNIQNSDGMGLRIMQQRAALIGGSLQILATANNFTVKLILIK